MNHFAVVWITTVFYIRKSNSAEYCNEETVKPRCYGNEVIVITKADFGRMKLGKCVKTDFGFLGCKADVKGFMDGRCSGRRQCDVAVADAELSKLRTCNREFSSYLDVEYRCQPVIQTNKAICQTPKQITLTEQAGYLANIFTEETGCGSDSVPWEIKTTPGKIINVTLYDFSWDKKDREFYTTCNALATISESSAPTRHPVCAQNGLKVSHAYRSVTNRIQMRLNRNPLPNDRNYFLLHFEVIGCPDPHLSKGAKLQRIDNKAIIMCNENPEHNTWTITCSSDDKWIGSYGNCSTKEAEPLVVRTVKGRSKWWLPFPVDISIALIAGVAFVIGCCIFVVGLFVLRRRNVEVQRRRQQNILLREAHDMTFGKYPAYPNPADPHFKVEPHSDSQGRFGQSPPIENEYAYVSDFPPPPSPKTLRMCSKDQSKQSKHKPKSCLVGERSPSVHKHKKPVAVHHKHHIQEQYFELDMFNSERRKSS